MKNYTSKLISAAILAATAVVPVTAFATDLAPHKVVVQSEVNASEISEMTDIIFEAALVNAAQETIENKADWFQVTYRDVSTETIRRNADSDAESRYVMDIEGNHVERVIETHDVTTQTQKIEFNIGTGPAPTGRHIYYAKDLVLPES